MAAPGSGDGGERLGPCPLCGREMIAGASVDRHHLVPRSRGGRLAEPLHRICHRKIHSLWSEAELAARYDSWEALRAAPELAAFLAWVAKRPPEFVSRTFTPKRKLRS